MKISDRMLHALGGTYGRLPDFPEGWTRECQKEKSQILRLVARGRIEMFKDSRLLVMADFYDELFPNAKWILVGRSLRESFRSRFGDPIPFTEWRRRYDSRMSRWSSCRPSRTCLQIDYSEFAADLSGSIRRIQTYLGLQLDSDRIENCMALYLPRR